MKTNREYERIEIKIKNTDYIIVLVDDRHYKLEEGNLYGLVDLYDKRIYIDRNYVNSFTTIVHEVIHAMMFEYGMDDDNWNEEKICLFMGAHYEELESILNQIKGEMNYVSK